MKTMFRLVLVLLIFGISCISFAEVVVSMHNHTYFSDGHFSPTEVSQIMFRSGADVVIINDHAEMINNSFNLANPITKHSGFSNWKKEIEEAQRLAPSGKYVIAGLEIGIGENRHNHLLFVVPNIFGNVCGAEYINKRLGISSNECSRMNILEVATRFAERLGETEDKGEISVIISEICQVARENGGFTVAAHPAHSLSGVKTFSYPFSDSIKYVDGIEFMNYGSDTARENMELLDHFEKDIFFTAGTDFHGFDDIIGPCQPKEKRFTIVDVDSAEPESVISAIRQGKCYAAFGDARIDWVIDTIVLPGGELAILYSFSGVVGDSVLTKYVGNINDKRLVKFDGKRCCIIFSQSAGSRCLRVYTILGESIVFGPIVTANTDKPKGMDVDQLEGSKEATLLLLRSYTEFGGNLDTNIAQGPVLAPTPPTPQIPQQPSFAKGRLYVGQHEYCNTMIHAELLMLGGNKALIAIRTDIPGPIVTRVLDFQEVGGGIYRHDDEVPYYIPCFDDGRVMIVRVRGMVVVYSFEEDSLRLENTGAYDWTALMEARKPVPSALFCLGGPFVEFERIE